jgi:hypothetical protein
MVIACCLGIGAGAAMLLLEGGLEGSQMIIHPAEGAIVRHLNAQ